MIFTKEEKELIIFGLQMQRNYIETGNTLLSGIDAEAMGQQQKIKLLDVDQCKLIIKLVELIDKVTAM